MLSLLLVLHFFLYFLIFYTLCSCQAISLAKKTHYSISCITNCFFHLISLLFASQWRWLLWREKKFSIILKFSRKIIFFCIFLLCFVVNCKQISQQHWDLLFSTTFGLLPLLLFGEKMKKFACEKLLLQFHLFSLFCTLLGFYFYVHPKRC